MNNMRDIVNDAASGKRTLVVRMGSTTAKTYHAFLILTGLLCLIMFAAIAFNVDITGAPGMHWAEPRVGPVRPRLNWTIEKLD